jgi:carboxyl-terminal processing protease
MKNPILCLCVMVFCVTVCRPQISPSLDPKTISNLVDYIKSHYESPEDYVLSKFKDHDIVFLGEFHRIKHDPELVLRLIPLLHDAGVNYLGYESSRRVDQPLIDSLLNAPNYDEQLALLIAFKEDVHWGYQEYVDIFKAAWKFNHTLPPGSRRFRILGLNNSPDWSVIKTTEDRDKGEVMRKVWHGETEEDWAKVLFDVVISQNEKALVYCGSHHAFTEYRQPIVINGKFIRFGDIRVGNAVFQKIGKRACTIKLHAPWISAEGYDQPPVLAADGYIDAVLNNLESKYQRVGFDLAGTSFGSLPGETSIYKFGYKHFTLDTIYDGYVCQGPLSSYRGVTAIKDFVNEINLAEARAQSPNPHMRNATASDFYDGAVQDADIPKRFSILMPVNAQNQMSKNQLAKHVAQCLQEISTYWKQGKIREAVTILETLYVIPNIRELDWAWTSTLYNLACGHSLLGHKEKALAYLSEAIQEGFSDYEQILKDSDLNNIRSDSRFEATIKPLRMIYFKWDSPSFSTNYCDDLPEIEKVAGLSKVWSEIKYGYVYFDHVPTLDWDSLFIVYLSEVKNSRNTKDYYRILQKMCAQLHDGHTRIEVPNEVFREMYAHPPIQTRILENKVMVVNVFNDSLKRSGIHAGLEIIKVDSIPVQQYARQFVEPYNSASTNQGQLTNTYEYYLLCGSKKKTLELELRDKDGNISKRILSRNYYRFQDYKNIIDFRLLEGNIAYVALNSFGDRNIIAQFDSLFPFIEQSKALILDLRENSGGNSDNAYRILGYLVDKPFKIVQGKSRNYNSFARTMGNRQTWSENPSVELPPNGSKLYSKPLAILISSRTASAAEDFCVALSRLKRGTLIGESTAGSTGQPLFYGLPGGGTGVVCTIRTFSPDGKEFVGTGIDPDITVPQTVSDVQSENDAALRTALSMLNSTNK